MTLTISVERFTSRKEFQRLYHIQEEIRGETEERKTDTNCFYTRINWKDLDFEEDDWSFDNLGSDLIRRDKEITEWRKNNGKTLI